MAGTESIGPGRSRTGIEGLDDILHGGFIEHRLYLIEGDPGSGKTTLAFQYLREGARNGERCLYITLSETKEELLAGARSHGWGLEGIDVVELLAENADLQGDSQSTMYHPSEVELTETTKSVLDAVRRVNPSRVVFDSLSELRLLAQSSLRYRRQILALKQFFVGRSCTVLLLDDHTSEGPDLQLQSIAHGVLYLEQLASLYGAERRRLRVLKFRGTSFRGGYHDFTIGYDGLKIFPRLIAAEHEDEFEHEEIKSGIDELDLLMGGGSTRGTSTLFLGPAGSGKSTIALQFAVSAARRGEHSVVFAFDEGAATIQQRCNALGIPFERGSAGGQIQLHQVDPAELSPGGFGGMVRDAVERDNARLVIIDSLNGYLQSMPEERFLISQLHELLAYLGKKGVTTMLVVAQSGIVGSGMRTPIDTSYLADAVVLFRYFEHRGTVRRAISVVKKRTGRHEETIREMRFGPEGISLSPPLSGFRGILTGIPVDERESEAGLI